MSHVGVSILFASVSLLLAACGGEPRPVAKDAAEPAASASSPAPVDSAAAQAIASQLPTYPLSVCPVSGKALGSHGAPYDHIHEGRLVRFCCDGCLKDFASDPAMYIAKIDSAAVASSPQGS
jgi:hypothetical protein